MKGTSLLAAALVLAGGWLTAPIARANVRTVCTHSGQYHWPMVTLAFGGGRTYDVDVSGFRPTYSATYVELVTISVPPPGLVRLRLIKDNSGSGNMPTGLALQFSRDGGPLFATLTGLPMVGAIEFTRDDCQILTPSPLPAP